MSHRDDVKEFYKAFQQDEFIAERASLEPDNIAPERLHLKVALIAEEFIELIEAIYGKASGNILKTAFVEAQAADDGTRDLVEAADAVADLDYVLNGLSLESGMPSDEIFAVVHESNMSKLGEDGKPVISDGVTPSVYDNLVKPKGKLLKGPNYFEATPEIVRILDEAK
jgi:predicted HAD superfamily Cof-like phosphohydrolase